MKFAQTSVLLLASMVASSMALPSIDNCQSHSECPSNKPACYYQKCVDPCEGTCGVNANCELRGITPVCSCPKGMTGDPFSYCRPLTDYDYCHPNPCGVNAECRPSRDKTGTKRALCLCPEGTTGNAFELCRPINDNDYCRPNPCGVNALCRPGHNNAGKKLAVCTCPDGMTGNPFKLCRPLTDSDLCNPNPCGTNANCHPGHDHSGRKRAICSCPKGYTGSALSSCQRV